MPLLQSLLVPLISFLKTINYNWLSSTTMKQNFQTIDQRLTVFKAFRICGYDLFFCWLEHHHYFCFAYHIQLIIHWCRSKQRDHKHHHTCAIVLHIYNHTHLVATGNWSDSCFQFMILPYFSSGFPHLLVEHWFMHVTESLLTLWKKGNWNLLPTSFKLVYYHVFLAYCSHKVWPADGLTF